MVRMHVLRIAFLQILILILLLALTTNVFACITNEFI